MLDAAGAVFLGFVVLSLGSALLLLAQTAIGFGETYAVTDHDTRDQVIDGLIQENGLLWGAAIVVLIGTPCPVAARWQALRTTRGIFDDRVATRKLLKGLHRRRGTTFCYKITSEIVEVTAARGDDEQHAWSDFQSVRWLPDVAVFALTSGKGACLIGLEALSPVQRSRFRDMVTKAGVPNLI